MISDRGICLGSVYCLSRATRWAILLRMAGEGGSDRGRGRVVVVVPFSVSHAGCLQASLATTHVSKPRLRKRLLLLLILLSLSWLLLSREEEELLVEFSAWLLELDKEDSPSPPEEDKRLLAV
jgi:hypothetical protein